jgi:hypothetical protein
LTVFVEMVDHRAGERPVQLVGEHEEATPAPASLRQVVGRAERRRGHRGVDDHDVGPQRRTVSSSAANRT